jgi:hypothetical protein
VKSEWEDSDPEDDVCVGDRFSSYEAVRCIREEEFYIENQRIGMKKSDSNKTG